MSDSLALPTDELQSLLLFLYNCPVGLIEFADNGAVQRLNPEAVNLLAPSLVDPQLENIFTTLRPAWPELADIVGDSPDQIGRLIEDHRFPTGQPNSPSWLSLTVVRVARDQNMLTILDVSKQVHAERSVHAGKRQLEAVFDSIDEGFCICEMICDADGAPVDYLFVKVNPLFETMTGLVDAVGKTALQLVPELEDHWIQMYATVGLGRESVRFEQLSNAMGRWFDVFGMPCEPHGHFALVFKDTTDRRLAERDLLAAAAVNEFRTSLIDSLQSIEDPVEVQAEAARLLRKFLEPARVNYTELNETGEMGIVLTHRDRGRGSEIVGQHRLNDYGPALMDEFRAGRTVVVADILSESRAQVEQRSATFQMGLGAYVVVPLIRRGRAVAGLLVHHTRAHAWTRQEIEIIEEAAKRTWAAVEQARADETLRIRHRRAVLMADLIAELELQSTPAAQRQCLAERLVPAAADYVVLLAPELDDPIVGLAHFDPAALEMLRERHRVDGSYTMTMADISNGETRLFDGITPTTTRAEFVDGSADPAHQPQLMPQSQMAVPLDLGGGLKAALLLGISRPGRRIYDDEDLRFLEETAVRVGIVLAATRLRNEEHLVAVRLQQALLPDGIHWHPNVAIEARYRAAGAFLEVGGDWYDTFVWPDGHIGVIVGDVVGHNLESAAVMGRLRAATSALAGLTNPSPAALLDALERFAQGPDGTEFATAACVVVHPTTGTLSYSSAGHPPILLVTPDGTCHRLSDAQHPPLGSVSVSRPHSEVSVSLQPGSLILMYSDGLIERRREPFDVGLARLEVVCAELVDHPIDVIADEIVNRLTALSAPEDDVVVACFRYTPALDRFERSTVVHPSQIGDLQTVLVNWLQNALLEWLTQRQLDEEAQREFLFAVGRALARATRDQQRTSAPQTFQVELTDHGHHFVGRVTCNNDARQPANYARRATAATEFRRWYDSPRTASHGDPSFIINVPINRGPINRGSINRGSISGWSISGWHAPDTSCA